MSSTQSPKNSYPLLISFSGIDGAGKSTQISRLCASVSEAGLTFRQLAFWDHVVAFPGLRAGFSHRFLDSEGGVGSPQKPVSRNDKNARRWYLTLGRAILYFTDALNLRRVIARARQNKSDVIIFDRFIYDQLATLPLDRPLGRSYAKLLLTIAPRPDIAFLLDAEPEEARARKPEYPVDFLHRYRASYLRLQNLAGMSLIHPGCADEVHRAITEIFEKSTGNSLPTSVSNLAEPTAQFPASL